MALRMSFLLLPALAVLCACNREPPAKTSADEPTFSKPTASEVFNLRSRCAELGRRILTENVIGPALAQTQTTHYNPKTNRCFVELDVFSGDTTKPRDINNIYLYDGQTGELLTWTQDDHGVKSGFGFHRLVPSGSPYNDALEEIADIMADDRKQ